MINLEDEARKRRERLKSSLVSNSSNSNNTETFIDSKPDTIDTSESKSKVIRSGRKRDDQNQDQEEFKVPEGEILLDSSGAELLGIDSQ